MGCALCPTGSSGSSIFAARDRDDVFEDLLGEPKAPETEGVPEDAPFITAEMVGPPVDFAEGAEKPDWKFELGPGTWKSYPPEEARELERYWLFYSRRCGQGLKGPRVAKMSLMKREGVVDFENLTCQVGTFNPRTLRREIVQPDWMDNAFFVQAFKAGLGAAGVEVEGDPEKIFDFKFNQDFRSVKDDGRRMKRGGQPYTIPAGWKRFAVSVKGQYDKGDNSWLKEDETGWAVAYHGTAKESLPGILCTGFKVGGRQKFSDEIGAGVYCTPEIRVAQHYSRPQYVDGHAVQIVLQLRVRPTAIKRIEDWKATDFERKYWVINNPADVRAYGVLIRELRLKDWIPPEAMVYGMHHWQVKQILQKLKDEDAMEEAKAASERAAKALEAAAKK